MLDVGGSGATLSSVIAMRHPRIRCIGYDMPALEPLAKDAIAKLGLGDRVEGGFNFTQSDFVGWAKEAGFRSVRFEALAGPTSAAIARK
jgi:hypothetical protein